MHNKLSVLKAMEGRVIMMPPMTREMQRIFEEVLLKQAKKHNIIIEYEQIKKDT